MNGRNETLEALLLQRPDLWRGSTPLAARLPAVATGFDALDRLLAGGGWPRMAVVEILSEDAAGGGMALLLPALATLSRESHWITLISTPWIPYAPAFAAGGIDPARLLLLTPASESDRFWALEQALRSGACGAVLAWFRRLPGPRLRRLQLAAEAGRGIAFIFCSETEQGGFAPAVLRLQVKRAGERLLVEILRQRRGISGQWAEVGVQRREDSTGSHVPRGNPDLGCAASRG